MRLQNKTGFGSGAAAGVEEENDKQRAWIDAAKREDAKGTAATERRMASSDDDDDNKEEERWRASIWRQTG
jgi:hypothetical protein